ncbi:hypothetical protein BFJ72_g5249 [Fusarium proliferatum]|uniref:Uncharacterized protein n=1 Tax=Gibberella intermedia TaxID=948311 RepID=A0A420TK59_GIBIN|nr:hypothetical protein BFJ72_g5249 [Fusarium proliferatum]
MKFPGTKIPLPQKPFPARRARARKGTKVKPLDSNRRSKSLERTKRQLEEENVSALYETSKLRQELRKEKRALAKERSERAR